MKKKIFILNLQVYNSFSNVEKIIKTFIQTKLNIKKIYIIDNNSTGSLDEKKRELKKLKKFFKNIILIVNNQNYGIGGSQKITFALIKNDAYDYLLNLQTSNRYFPNLVAKSLQKNIILNKDYYLFSRFLKKNSTKKYNFLRKYLNIFFIYLTKICTKTYFSDPGQSIYCIKKKVFKRLKEKQIKKLTNSSHFPHFFNIIIYKSTKHIKKIKEIPIIWKEGNIKSHLNVVKYPLVLFFSLIKYYFSNSFFSEKDNKFNFKTLK